MKQKIKLGIILGVEFVAIAVILILIFLAGKKSYTVTFDLNGGTLLSGDLVQTVSQGKSATAPKVAKEGCYLHSWSASYKQVTRDIVVEAVWEWETSIGFDYVSSEDSNYCEIEGCFKDLSGDVYVGVYHNNKKVLGVRDNAFAGCEGITKIHMLDGILSIGKSVFKGCTSLVSIELPGTLTKLGSFAFEDCVSLETVVMPEDLKAIPEGAFKGCTSLKTIIIPASVESIGDGAFFGCTSLESVLFENGNLKAIGNGAFAGCTSLATVEIPATVESIGNEAFLGCTSLSEVVFMTDTVFVLDESEAPGSAMLVHLGLKSIGNAAFADCESLLSVELPFTIETVGSLAFNNPLTVIKIPFAVSDIPEGFAEDWAGESVVDAPLLPEPDPDPDPNDPTDDQENGGEE